jgi:hypothetical protein
VTGSGDKQHSHKDKAPPSAPWFLFLCVTLHNNMVVGSSEVDAGVDVEEELRGMTLGQEVNEEDSGDDEIEATTPGGTRKKNKSLVKGMGKGIKNLWKSTFSGKDDPVCASIRARALLGGTPCPHPRDFLFCCCARDCYQGRTHPSRRAARLDS